MKQFKDKVQFKFKFNGCTHFKRSSSTYIFWLHYGFEVIEGDLAVVPHSPLENFLEPSQVFSGQLISFSRIGN